MRSLKKEFIAEYKKIADDIMADIKRGVYKPGDQIQGQNYYAEKFQASRTTVRNAISQLINQGVLEASKGKGTFVKRTYSPDGEKKPSNRRFLVVEIKNEEADKTVAAALEIEPGEPVVRIERVRIVDNAAENYQISYIARNLVKEVDFTQEDMETGSIYHYLSNVGNLLPQYSDENIYAVECPEHVAEYFHVKRKTPILLIHRVTHSMDGIVMEYCLDYLGPSANGLRIRR